MTWNVADTPQSQLFYAQGVAGSINLGDQSFDLTTALFLYDPATDPPANQQTSPKTTANNTVPKITIVSNRDDAIDPTGTVTGRRVLVGQYISVNADFSPAILFAAPKFKWTIPGTTVASYKTSSTEGIEKDLPSLITSKGTDAVTFYWIDGTFEGQSNEVSVTCTSGGPDIPLTKSLFRVYKPNADFVGMATAQKPQVDTWYDAAHSGNYLSAGKDPAVQGSPGWSVTGSISVPDIGGASDGTVALVRLTKPNDSRSDNNTIERLTTKGLDPANGDYVYDTKFPNKVKAILASDGKTVITSDDEWYDIPGVRLDGTDPANKVSMSENFREYIMFQPFDRDSNDIWVALSTDNWSATGAAHLPKGKTNVAANWVLDGANSVAPGHEQFQPTSQLPHWTMDVTAVEDKVKKVKK